VLSTTPNYSLLKAAITGAEAQNLNQYDLASMLIPMLEPDEQELDTHQAAAWIGNAPSTLENWRSQKKGPKFRKRKGPNSEVRYTIGDLKEWKASESSGKAEQIS